MQTLPMCTWMGSCCLKTGVRSGRMRRQYSSLVHSSAISSTLGSTKGTMSRLTNSDVSAGKMRYTTTLYRIKRRGKRKKNFNADLVWHHIFNATQSLPWVAWGGLWANPCRTGTSAGCLFGIGSQNIAGSRPRRHQKKESGSKINAMIRKVFRTNSQKHCSCIVAARMQTLVIWSASGLTVGVTLSSILTCSRTSSGILFSSAGLMVLNCNRTTQQHTQGGKLESTTNPLILFDLLQDFVFSRGD